MKNCMGECFRMALDWVSLPAPSRLTLFPTPFFRYQRVWRIWLLPSEVSEFFGKLQVLLRWRLCSHGRQQNLQSQRCDNRFFFLDFDLQGQVPKLIYYLSTGGEALLLFSSFNQIRGIYLKSKVYFSVSTQQNRVIGISHNGHQVYWTEINRAEAAIVKSNEDGSEKVVIVDSGKLNTQSGTNSTWYISLNSYFLFQGLGLPEDLAVDYVTGNIYFTDGEKKHIGVCSESSICTVLHNDNVDKPRAIALYPEKG